MRNMRVCAECVYHGDGVTPKLEFVELAVVEQQMKEGLRKKKKFEEFLQATMHGITHPWRSCISSIGKLGQSTCSYYLMSYPTTPLQGSSVYIGYWV